ncbi:MAG: type IV pilus modification protein PilV [Magnetococcus sp. MYC-9]
MSVTVPRGALRRGHARSGFTLLEILITLVILSVGLLGLAKMQLSTIQHNHSALLRSQAIVLAYDIFERMRANRTLAINGAYNTGFNTVINSPPDCMALPCTPAQMVSFDLAQWKNDLALLLPEGSGDVGLVVSGGMEHIVTISIRWNDGRNNNVAAYKTFSWSSEI